MLCKYSKTKTPIQTVRQEQYEINIPLQRHRLESSYIGSQSSD